MSYHYNAFPAKMMGKMWRVVWEETGKFVTLEFAETGENEILFDGAVCRLAAPNSMTIEAKMTRKGINSAIELPRSPDYLLF